jgi:hypothetical protein
MRLCMVVRSWPDYQTIISVYPDLIKTDNTVVIMHLIARHEKDWQSHVSDNYVTISNKTVKSFAFNY